VELRDERRDPPEDEDRLEEERRVDERREVPRPEKMPPPDPRDRDTARPTTMVRARLPSMSNRPGPRWLLRRCGLRS
jgi:hypothetical protein